MYSEFKLNTLDGAALFCRKWIPEGEVKAIFVLIHGKGENTGRYLSFGEFLCDNGLAVYAPDLRGHGLSSGAVGHTAPRDKILADIDLVRDTAMKEQPDKPVFIYGHSMGGHLVLDYRRQRQDKARAFIISSPWLYLKKKLPAPGVKLVCGLAKILPYFAIPTGIDIKAISSIEAEQERYAKDKTMNSVITAATFRDIDHATKDIFKNASDNKQPFLLIHGSDDLLIDVTGSRNLAQLSAGACEYHEFPGSRHEILNDVGAEDAKKVMLDYILARI